MKELGISLVFLVVLAIAVVSGSAKSVTDPMHASALPSSSGEEPPSTTEESGGDDGED